ncbi:MAG: CheR family methyltransferase [Chloroflexota bacterium]
MQNNYSEIKPIVFVEIREDEFHALSSLVYDQIGINLTEEKRTLLTGRLQKILRREKFRSFREYYDYVTNDKTGDALTELANTISTNHTFFGREKDHFDYFLNVTLPEVTGNLRAKGSNDLRVWCAGCSTGEEAYTLVMLMMERLGAQYSSWNAGALATDISASALEKAVEAIYPEERVRPLDENLKSKYMKKLPSGFWTVTEAVKKEVLFRKFNLMSEVFPFRKPFDVIFCRNVMIYFDPPTRERLINKFYDCLVDGGYLFIGHSETIRRDASAFKYIMPAVYKK